MNITTNQELADHIIERLNEISKTDPTAMVWLLENRITCNEALADHPTVIVYTDKDGDPPSVGMLGILNGIVGLIGGDGPKKDFGYIASVWDDDGEFVNFTRTDHSTIKVKKPT